MTTSEGTIGNSVRWKPGSLADLTGLQLRADGLTPAVIARAGL